MLSLVKYFVLIIIDVIYYKLLITYTQKSKLSLKSFNNILWHIIIDLFLMCSTCIRHIEQPFVMYIRIRLFI